MRIPDECVHIRHEQSDLHDIDDSESIPTYTEITTEDTKNYIYLEAYVSHSKFWHHPILGHG